jgi:hypothetical protein
MDANPECMYCNECKSHSKVITIVSFCIILGATTTLQQFLPFGDLIYNLLTSWYVELYVWDCLRMRTGSTVDVLGVDLTKPSLVQPIGM